MRDTCIIIIIIKFYSSLSPYDEILFVRFPPYTHAKIIVRIERERERERGSLLRGFSTCNMILLTGH